MRIDRPFFPNGDVDGGWPYLLPTEPRLLHFSYFQIPGSAAIQEVLTSFSDLAGALVFCVYGAANSNLRQKFSVNPHRSRSIQSGEVNHLLPMGHQPFGLPFVSRKRVEFTAPLFLGKFVNYAIRHLKQEIGQLQWLPIFALTTAFVPPFDHFSPKVLAAPVENVAEQMSGDFGQSPGGDRLNGCARFSLSEIIYMRDAIEPRTGVKFPKILGRDSDQNDLEVLVGTGSRAMKVVKVKTIKIYAFGLYIQPYSVCKKLGPKYASSTTDELNDHSTFLVDLLREDIDMTVRLVVIYNGLKISAVKDVFEKSLRNQLQKVNPETDYHCLKAFGSYFTQDIPLPVGTAIDFRQTADGHLITEIGGKHIGAVHSKELCRAFFDMYIGDMPVSAQAKEEVAKNVAGLIRRC